MTAKEIAAQMGEADIKKIVEIIEAGGFDLEEFARVARGGGPDAQVPRVRATLDSVVAYLGRITDHRDNRGKRYSLTYALAIMVIGELAKKGTCTGAADFAERNIDLIGAYFGEASERGIPSHDCLNDILAGVNVDELEMVYEEFMAQVCDPKKDRLGIPEVTKNVFIKKEGRLKRGEPRYELKKTAVKVLNHYCVDGKAVNGSTDRKGGGHTPYIGGIYNACAGLYPGQVFIANGKETGEATEIRRWLGSNDLGGIIVTADALHTSVETMGAIAGSGGEFCLKVKRNSHKVQYSLANELIDCAIEDERVQAELDRAALDRGERPRERKSPLSRATAVETYNGLEREYEVIVCSAEGGEFTDYCPLISHVARVRTTTWELDGDGARVEGSAVSYECCLFLSCGLAAADVLGIYRAHWGIESSHWILDRHMDEDRSTGRVGGQIYARAILKRWALAILTLLWLVVDCVGEDTSIEERFTLLQAWPFLAVGLVAGLTGAADYQRAAAAYFRRMKGCLSAGAEAAREKLPKLSV